MSTEDSKASWHPAFMPNSASELASRDHSTTTDSDEPTTFAFRKESDTLISEPSHIQAPSDESTPPSSSDNQNHPELDNLRSALTTSLASPGGVEMSERPVHSDGLLENDNDEATRDKAQFPSEGPSQPLGTTDSTSFGASIHGDIDWGKEHEEHPEWDLGASDPDPFKSMPPSDRTNSFPPVPPSHMHREDLHENPMPHSQVENIMSTIDEPSKNLFDDEDDGDDFFSQKSKPQDVSDTDFQIGEGIPSSGLDNSHQEYEGISEQVDIQEERYEEGIPLVPHPNDTVAPPQHGNSNPSLFGDDATGEEESFFEKIGSQDAPSEQQNALNRKSTFQVIDSIHFDPNEEREDDEFDVKNTEESQDFIHNATGGGIAVSKSTVLSAVLNNSQEPVPDLKIDQDSTEEDLAAKWKAALDEDEFLDDDDDDDFIAKFSEAQKNAVDPSSFFRNEDGGFLDKVGPGSDAGGPATSPLPRPVTGASGEVVGFSSLTGSAHANHVNASSRYTPSGATQTVVQPPASGYAPASPFVNNLASPASSGVIPPTVSQPHAAIPPSSIAYGVQPPQPRPDLPKAQSFADKAKGGYSSPYDLPMEVVKPRKRASMQQMSKGYNTSGPVAPPPRSSSMYAQGPPPSRGSTSSLSPPSSSHSTQPPTSAPSQSQPGNPQGQQPTLKSKPSFFEDLPIPSRPKSTPRHHVQQASPPPLDQHPPLGENTISTGGTSVPPAPFSHGLVAPPQINPYGPTQIGASRTPPPPTSRYSPAPVQNVTGPSGQIPPAQARYAAAPIQQRQPVSPHSGVTPPPPILPHQPRTSSPLAHFERSHEQAPSSGHFSHHPISLDRRASSGFDYNTRTSTLPPTEEVDEQNIGREGEHKLQGLPPNVNAAPPRRSTSNYIPDHTASTAVQESGFVPPRRSQTQSPGAAANGFRGPISPAEPYQRPTSVQGPTSPSRKSDTYSSISGSAPVARSRGYSQALNLIAPNDGREHDPLQRWKGCPIIDWGVGGTIVTTFPKEVPRYGMGQTAPMIMRSPGEIKIRNVKDVYQLEARYLSFPGPLKGKSKKKDVLAWLTVGIEKMDEENQYLRSLPDLSHEDKRKEERVLLWKVLRVLIEHDGVLEGNPTVTQAVRAVLSPGLEGETSATTPQYTTGADLSGIYRSAGPAPQAEPVAVSALDEIRKHLLKGDREKAVWQAVDERLWAHALLISNTFSPDLYKRVSQEFIQKEVKSVGENTESLAALYEIFAGNFEESIDELVPPSARAGFQMISTSTVTTPSKSAIDGLDRWRETLGLILSNRSAGDSQAINALGKLLSGYGRAEAAHICFLFGRTNSVFSGVDDPLANIVLLGSDHLRQPYESERDLESILLSEVYEFALSLSASSNIPASAPHLSAYKLYHATILAEFGQRDKALQYCESIASAVTSQTRRSPYHHGILVNALDDLNKRLKQSPKDESSSWISKPSIDKVSGTVWARFNKFVAGDENDAGESSTGDSNADIGPFARIAGGTPTISRSPSNAELYSSYPSAPQSNGAYSGVSGGRAVSRYTPGAGTYTPPHVSDHATSPYVPQHSNPLNQVQNQGTYDPLRTDPAVTNPLPSSQLPTPSYYQASPTEPQAESEHIPPPNPYNTISQSYSTPSYTPPQADTPLYGQFTPGFGDQGTSSGPEINGNSGALEAPQLLSEPQSSSDYQPTTSGYDSPISGYEPPTSAYEPPTSGYEPPSYEPAPMNDEPDSPVDAKPKKKSFMDDDNDEYDTKPRAVEKTKAEKDREADDAFRKAAEADAQRDAAAAAATAKKGWGFGGWFGGKKESVPDAAPPAQPGKPIRANLGEASSFYYDPDLKRWVNKKGGKEADSTPSATPPPPRAGPPRTASGPPIPAPTSAPTSAPPLGTPPISASVPPSLDAPRASGPPPSKSGGAAPENGTLAAPPTMSRSASNGSAAPPASGPPSRPPTSMSNASSIDDLLGPAMPRKGGTAKKAKKGRGYIDVMGEKSAS